MVTIEVSEEEKMIIVSALIRERNALNKRYHESKTREIFQQIDALIQRLLRTSNPGRGETDF